MVVFNATDIDVLPIGEINFYRSVDELFFPLRTEPVISDMTGSHISSIRIYAGTGKYTSCMEITRQMLDNCIDIKEVVDMTKKKIN